MSADHPLDNAVWHALTTSQAGVAEGSGAARRYRRDVSPFHAVDALDTEGWKALAELAGPGRVVVLFRDEIGPAPEGWTHLMGGEAHQLVAEDRLEPVPGVEARPLQDGDVDQMLALVELTQPGPFARRTIELGGYVGVFEGDRLVAMAGERMRVPGYAEISAVCTHPEAQRRGLGAALTGHVGAAIQDRGETAFLHVAVTNHNAERVYRRLGFRPRRVVQFVAWQTPNGETP
jgi:predicted GNAT family acetyltransferase